MTPVCRAYRQDQLYSWPSVQLKAQVWKGRVRNMKITRVICCTPKIWCASPFVHDSFISYSLIAFSTFFTVLHVFRLFAYATRNRRDVAILHIFLLTWIFAELLFNTMILLNCKNSSWFYFFHWPSVAFSYPQAIAVLNRPNTEMDWRMNIARLVSTRRKACFYAIYFSFICFNHVRGIKIK